MSKHDDNFYHAVIKHTFPDAHNIRKPHVLGWVAPAIYIVDTQDQTIICKFNQQEIILHNKATLSAKVQHHVVTRTKVFVNIQLSTKKSPVWGIFNFQIFLIYQEFYLIF